MSDAARRSARAPHLGGLAEITHLVTRAALELALQSTGELNNLRSRLPRVPWRARCVSGLY